MKTINKVLLAIISLAIFYSCEDLIEEDISDDMIVTISPQNNAEIESNVVNFRWNLIDGADKYRVQIYSSNQTMVLDSLVSSESFTFSVNPGSYQWRVRGENFAYETPYTFPANFKMIETLDLTNQQVQLISPDAGVYLRNMMPSFSWQSISAAQSYNFQLINVTNGNAILHQESGLTNTSINLPVGVITADAQYQWKVQAINPDNATQTQFTSRNFYVDTTIPNQPQNVSPINNATQDTNVEVTLVWSAPTDSGIINSPITYLIQIASDASFNNIIQTDSATLATYDFTFTATGNYYWRVRAVDLAGNQGAYSSYSKISVQ